MFAWITSNWGAISAGLGALLALATVITGFTDTPKDDSVVAWLRKALAFLGVAQPADATGSLKAPLTRPNSPPPILRERLDLRD